MSTADGPIIVTGAGGYLGGRVAGALGNRVRAIVRRPVPWLPTNRQAAGDLLRPDAPLRHALTGSAVVHLAGHNEVLARTDPDRAVSETIAATQTIVDAARANGVRRIVYVSTIHVYGTHLTPGAVIDESVEPAPTSPYAEARAACERLLLDAKDIDAVILRLSNAVGAPEDPSVDRWTLVASELVLGAVLDRTMTLRSSGLQTRDFITLDDAARIVAAVASGDAPAGVYNLVSGRSVTIRDLAGLIGDRVDALCGYRPDLVAPPVDGDPEEPYTFTTTALSACGLRAEQPLATGVDELIEHCRKHRSKLDVLRGST